MESTPTHNSADAVQDQLTIEEILARIQELQKISFNLRGQLLGQALSFETVPRDQYDDSTDTQSSKKSHTTHPTLPELATLLVQTEHQLDIAQATQKYIDKKYHEFECTQALNKIQQTLRILINLEQKIHLLIDLKQSESAATRRQQTKISFDPFKKV